MCGGGHEILWLDRYFKNEARLGMFKSIFTGF